MEVLSIHIKKMKKKRKFGEEISSSSTKVHGYISICIGSDCYVYKREKSKADEVSVDGFYPVVAGLEHVACSSYGGFEFHVDLKNEEDREFCSSTPELWPKDYSEKYNKVLEETIAGVLGSVTIRYVMYEKAYSAGFEMRLMDPAASQVYGEAYVTNGNLNGVKSIIFRKSESESKQIGNRGTIPLSKACVAVPLKQRCTVTFKITDAATTGTTFSGSMDIVPVMLRTTQLPLTLVGWTLIFIGFLYIYDLNVDLYMLSSVTWC